MTDDAYLRIDFTAAGADRSALHAGWSHPEPQGSWTDARQAVLRLALEPTPFGYHCAATLHGYIHDPELSNQIIVVAIGDQSLFRGTVRGWRQIAFDIPAALIDGRDPVDLVIEIPNATAPQTYGGSDTRLLGLSLTELVLTRLTAPPAPGIVRPRSFDLFDTLVARRCAHPQDVFRLVERSSGMPGFAALRAKAEHEVEQQFAGENHTLADIYARLHGHHGLSRGWADWLAQIELETEFAQSFPIAERCKEVRNGDVIIADRYFPPEFVTRLVTETCGLYANPVFVAPAGKSRADIWAELQTIHGIAEHTGDDDHADDAVPRQFGIATRVVKDSQRTEMESMLAQAGLDPLANLMREARLSLPADDMVSRHLQLSQIEANFPTLFLASLELFEMARRREWQFALFAARNGYLWQILFDGMKEILGVTLRTQYFCTSRAAKAHPSPAYIAYFAALCDQRRGVVVDVCGTGWSTSRLMQAAGITDVEMFMLNRINDGELIEKYRNYGEIDGPVRMQYLLTEPEGVVAQLMNRAGHPMVGDVAFRDGVALPIFSPISFSAEAMAVMRVQHAAFLKAVSLLGRISRAEMRRMQAGFRIDILIRTYQAMTAYRPFLKPLLQLHALEDDRVDLTLRRAP